jgi:hypothetical protein
MNCRNVKQFLSGGGYQGEGRKEVNIVEVLYADVWKLNNKIY